MPCLVEYSNPKEGGSSEVHLEGKIELTAVKRPVVTPLNVIEPHKGITVAPMHY